jgi:hypothetical protein
MPGTPPASPYQDLPPEAFWRTGVVQQPEGLQELYAPRFALDRTTRIVTAGSCFAQHIGDYLRRRGYQVVDAEPAPPGMSADAARRLGYGIYSARYGNIYTVNQFLQLLQEAEGSFTPGDVVWEKDGRYFDALRPGIEPEGFDCPEEVLALRKGHLENVRKALHKAELVIFTLGLTEAWVHRESGTVFPTAPGTIAGHYDPARYAFKNFTQQEIVSDFRTLRNLVRNISRKVRFLVTVSPVPLTATASGQHVLVATVHSKSVLRAAAGTLCATLPDVDYFPSYEIIATPFLGKNFYDSNCRSVTERGVETVMKQFLAAHGDTGVLEQNGAISVEEVMEPDAAAEAICEEALLDAFGQ